MFSRILLPTDFSGCSSAAAAAARLLAERFGSRVLLLHVLEEAHSGAPSHRAERPLEELRTRMEQFAQEGMDDFLSRHFSGFENVDTMIATGTPSREIVRVARESASDLIVIGTHGRTGVEKVLFGSTAEKVVRTAPCPVLSVREAGAGAARRKPNHRGGIDP